MGLGLLFSAISGAANGTSEELDAQQKVADRLDINKAKSDADLQRQKALSEFSLSQANANRASQAKQFQDARQGLLNSQIEANVNRIEGNEPGTADYVPLSAMSQAEKDQGAPDPLLAAIDAGGHTGQLSAANIVAQLAARRSAAAVEALNSTRIDLANKTLAETAKHNRATEANQLTGGKLPSDVKTAQWLEANKDNPAAMAAWKLSRNSKTPTVQGIAAIIMRGDPGISTDDVITQAQAIHDLSLSKSLLDKLFPKK